MVLHHRYFEVLVIQSLKLEFVIVILVPIIVNTYKAHARRL